MGMFNEVRLICPNCGNGFTYQSKWGECTLERFTLEDAPLSVIADVHDEGNRGRLYCEHCETALELKVRIQTDLVIKGDEIKDDWREV